MNRRVSSNGAYVNAENKQKPPRGPNVRVYPQKKYVHAK